ncbi:MAG TPA: PQQ-binding-like beta-propeller repeat protein, partial [Armatimonadaceae bacterium]|nr:PQQ-binding-like beta-propeller repeat protein [Armatimonadaceae bacterium]
MTTRPTPPFARAARPAALTVAATLLAAHAAQAHKGQENTTLSTTTAAASADAKPLAERTYGAPEDLGKPLKSVTLLSSQVAEEDGRPVLVGLVSSGDPELNVVDLRTNRLLRSFTLKEAASCWGGAVTPDGRVYLLTFTRLYRYDPKTKRVDDLGVPVAGEKAFWTLSQDEKGRVYGGTYPGGKVFRFDPATGQYRVLGDVGQEYVRSTAYYRGTLYAGTGPTPSGRIVAFDVETGKQREVPLPAFGGKTPMWVYGLDVRGDKLFGYFVFPDKSKTLAVYDLTTGAWRPEQFEGYGDLYVGAERDGNAYFQWKGTLHEVDLATLAARSTGIPSGASYRGGGWVDLRSEEFPGPSLVTATGEGDVVVLNPETGARKTLPSVMKSDSSDIQAITAG